MTDRTTRRFVVGGGVAVAAYFALPRGGIGQGVAFPLFALVAVAAIVSGVVRNRPRDARPWVLLATGVALFAAGDVVWLVYEAVFQRPVPFPSVADALYLGGYPPLLAGMWLLVRGAPRRDRGWLLDAAIVWVSLGGLTWLVVGEPTVGALSLERAVSLAYPLADILLIGVAARLLFAPVRRSAAFLLLTASVVTLLTADVGYDFLLSGDAYHSGHPVDALWLLSYVLIGAAALHPSMSAVPEGGEGGVAPGRWRLFVLAGLAGLPIVLLFASTPDPLPGLTGTLAAISLVLFTLVLARMGLLLGEVEEAAASLRASHDELQERDRRFQLVARATNDTVWDWDIDAGRIWWNRGVQTVFGYSPGDIEPAVSWWEERLHPDDRERVLAKLGAVTASEQDSWADEYRFERADGSYAHVLDRGFVVRDGEGRAVRMIGSMMDISARKQADEQRELALEHERAAARRLRDVNDLKDSFLTAVSHELRTPLTAVSGFADTLRRQRLAPADRELLLDRLVVNAQKLDRLLADLLDLDRLSRGIVQPRRTPTDLAALATRVLEESDTLRDHPVDVDVEPVVLAVDAAKVERIVENLVSNAGKHTPPGTRVRVSVGPTDRGALIAVEDEGAGVPEHARETVFRAFHRGADAPTHSPGFGIGLSLVDRFAELHGGRAWVEESETGGASFRVFLPAVYDDGPPEPERDVWEQAASARGRAPHPSS